MLIFKRVVSMGKCFFTISLLLILGAVKPVSMAAMDEYESAARAFAVSQLKDPNTYSPAPPSELNPYKDMSPEQIGRIQAEAMKNGSILTFYPSGLPSMFLSYADHQKQGLEKGWYENGRVKYEEHYHHDELADGIYFDPTGIQLGEVKRGTGIKIVYPKLYEQQSRALGFTAYKNGQKDGVETIYRDYEKKIKSSESHYIEGKLHGIKTLWMSTGQKNSEENYENGVQHGKSICWYENGKPRSIIEYNHDQIVNSTFYYETGLKSREMSNQEENKWFPSGQLMLHTMKDNAGTIVSGQSFDTFGNQNGNVVNGVGSLIEADTGDYKSSLVSLLYIYKPTFPSISMGLPSIVAAIDYGPESSSVHLRLTFHVDSNSDWQGGTVTILLPEGCRSDDPLRFTLAEPVTNKEIELGSITITLPQPYEKWNGSILADIEGVVRGCKVRYQPVAARHEVQEEIKPTLQSKGPRKAKAFQTPGRSMKTSKDMPHHAGGFVPADAQPVDSWRLLTPDRQIKEWALYRSPSILLVKEGQEEDWHVVRSNFNYRPGGMLVRAADFVVVWGTESTADVSKGIPYHVEKSLDGGKTWLPLEIPRVDYLLDMALNDTRDIILVSGIRIGKDGIPAGKEWYETAPIMMFSKDGEHFIEQVSTVGDSGWGEQYVRSAAPNGKYKAFISMSHGIDSTSYSLYFVKAHDEIPQWQQSLPEGCEIVWSSDSRILAIQKGGQIILYYDVEGCKIEEVPGGCDYLQSEKNNKAGLEFDQKVRSLLDTKK
jgi:antitoxin component YwqK of YwqJK toxin-antitoxin module